MKPYALNKLAFPGLLVGLFISQAIQCHAEDPLFVPAPGSPVTVGKGSGEVVLADLNRDGHLDLLTKHLLTQNVAVRFGDGKGGFKTANNGPMSFTYQPGAIRLADVNNDNVLDLGIASKEGNNEYVRVFLGTGRGSFTPAAGSPISTSASQETYKPSLRFVDINEDGKIDLVTANGRRNSIEILFGDGRGSFSQRPSVTLECGRCRHSLEVGDVDGDRHLDLVIAFNNETDGGPGRLVVKRGDGKGAFADLPGALLSLPPDPRLGMLADVNGDQRPDAVLSHSNNHLSVLLNRGNGVFTPAPASPFNIGIEAFAVVVADVNQDGNNDLIAATVNSVTVLLGDGRKFAPASGSPFSAGPGAYYVTVGDLNRDGKPDLAASSFEGNAITVLLGR